MAASACVMSWRGSDCISLRDGWGKQAVLRGIVPVRFASHLWPQLLAVATAASRAPSWHKSAALVASGRLRDRESIAKARLP
jgi:hypothetical protein